MTKKKILKSKTFSMLIGVLAIVLFIHGISVIIDVAFGSLKSESANVTVSEGYDSRDVSRLLKDEGVIKHRYVFELLSWLKGADERYYPGDFVIKKGSGYVALINGLTYRSNYKTTNITVPEGANLKEIAKIVSKTGYVSEDEFNDALKEKYDYEFLKGIKRDNKLEGYLFPDTYNISNQMSARDIIELMLARFEDIFTDEYEHRAKQLGYDMDEIVTLASVIEAEAATQKDRVLVSGVFHNRLKSNSYPYLESCATVQYILGQRKAILSAADTKIKSPYNTYINKGLPIGPICSPGKAALEAALYPSDTSYYFFQSDADGKIYYASTLSEHEKIRQQIQN